MKYPASKDFVAALDAVAGLYNNEKGNLSQEEEKVMFQIMSDLLRAYSAYWQRQQCEESEELLEKALNEGRISTDEAKLLRKTLRGHLA